jgi:hypothetical protein
MLEHPSFTSKNVPVRTDRSRASFFLGRALKRGRRLERFGKRLCLARLKSSLNPKSIAPLLMGFALSRLGFGSARLAFSPARMGLSLAPQK